MEVLNDLKIKAEYLFQPFGGLQYARLVLTDAQINDICSFYGHTVFISPFVEPYTTYTTSNSQIPNVEQQVTWLPVPRTDFKQLGYLPNSKVRVLDTYYQPVFETKLQPVYVDEQEQFLWGLTQAQRRFTAEQPHGALFYLLINTSTGQKLIQLIVQKQKHPLDRQEEIARLEELNKKRKAGQNHHEILLTLPKTTNKLLVSVLTGQENSNITERQLVAHPQTIQLEKQGGTTVYLQPEYDTYISIREQLLNENTYNTLLDKTNTQAFTILINAGYKQLQDVVLNSSGTVRFVRNDLNYTSELILRTQGGFIAGIEEQHYRNVLLDMSTVKGEETWRLETRGELGVFKATNSLGRISQLGFNKFSGGQPLSNIGPYRKSSIQVTCKPLIDEQFGVVNPGGAATTPVNTLAAGNSSESHAPAYTINSGGGL